MAGPELPASGLLASEDVLLPPGPAWPPQRWISPSALKSFNNCAHRIRLQYLDQLPQPPVFNLFLNKGNIAHQLLAQSAARIARGESVLDEGTLFDLSIRRLPPWVFPSPEAREGHARDIVRWVQYGQSHLDRSAQYLKIEKMGHRQIPWQPEGTRLTVVTKPDLVLLRTDSSGEQFIEIIDYKTGARYIDDTPPVIMRYVLKDLLKTLTTDTSALRVIFTYIWLDHGILDEIPMTIEYSTREWGRVIENIDRLLAEREWKATPSMLCNYCPYNGNACHAFEEMERDQESF